jgi:peptide/nickel transport system substrate-binding protein
MTAEDVKFSIDRAIASPAVAYIVDFISEVIVDDPYNVTIVSKAPYAPILANLAVPFSGIVPKALVEADEEAFILNPVGTGAYKFVEWKQGDYVKLTANPDYFRGAPKTPNLQMRVVPEAAQRTIAIETGEADFAYDIAPNDIAKVEENADLQMISAPPLSVWYVSFNMNKAPFDNVKVRQAISYAINQDDIIQAVRYGAAEAAHSLIPPAAFGYSDKAIQYNFDLEKAKALMAEAGYADGFSCNLWVNENQERVEACQIVQSQLKQIGIEVTVDVMEFGTFIDQTSAGEHDLAFFGWTCSTADADYNYYSLAHSTQQGAPGNRAFINDPEVDRLIEAGRTTADPVERQKYYDELEVVLSEMSPNAFLYYSVINVGGGKDVQGFEMDANGYHHLYTVYREA